MTVSPRLVLAASSVAVVLGVVIVAIALAPAWARSLLVPFGVLAGLASVLSVASDARDLTPALLLSLPPVVALGADGSPSWMIGPLAVSLLVAGELSALSWEGRGPGPLTAVTRARLLHIAPLAGLALAGSLVVSAVATGPAPGGTVAVGLAALTLAVLGRLVLRRAG